METPAVLVNYWEQQTNLSSHTSSGSIIARLFLVASSSQFPEDPLCLCLTEPLLGKMSTSQTAQPHLPSRLQVVILSKMMLGSMFYDCILFSLLLASASGTSPAAVSRTSVHLLLEQAVRVEQAEPGEPAVEEEQPSAGCGEWARRVAEANRAGAPAALTVVWIARVL